MAGCRGRSSKETWPRRGSRGTGRGAERSGCRTGRGALATTGRGWAASGRDLVASERSGVGVRRAAWGRVSLRGAAAALTSGGGVWPGAWVSLPTLRWLRPESPAVAHARRGPLGTRLPRDHPSAGQRAGPGSGSRSRRSMTRLVRDRALGTTTTVDGSGRVFAAGAAALRRPCCWARLRRARRKRRMLRFSSGVECTIQATAAMTTSHSPIASTVMTKPRIGPPPFLVPQHPRGRGPANAP
jgi:hypothetical protein